MPSDGNPRVDFRLPEELLDALDDAADKAGLSRSDLLRRFAHFGLEAQAEQLAREGEIKNEIQQQIERNQLLRKLLPSKWRSHVRGLFRDDLRDDTTPEDLRTLAGGYRLQAEKMEELAATVPEAPDDPPLVEIVDEELRYAMDAADLSTWYETVDNPHERHLSGVEDGQQERKAVVEILAGVVDSHRHLEAVYRDRSFAPSVDADDLPDMAVGRLPADVSADDVADAANQLLDRGVTGDEVRENFPTVDPLLSPEEIPAGDEPDEPDVTTTMGGLPRDAFEHDDEPTAGDGRPQVADADETTQAEIVQALAAADGGRSLDAMGYDDDDADTVEDLTMNPATNTDDENRTDGIETLAEWVRDGTLSSPDDITTSIVPPGVEGEMDDVRAEVAATLEGEADE